MTRRSYEGGLLVLVLCVTACSSGGSKQSTQTSIAAKSTTTVAAAPTSTSTPVVPMQHFDASRVSGLKFDHPRAWNEFHYVETSTFADAIVFLSNGPLHDPCDPSMSSSEYVGSTTCGYPIKTLPPGDVVVSWSIGARPFAMPEIPHPNTTISTEPADVTTERPGECGRYGAQETITAAIREDHDHEFDMVACLRGPNLARNATLVQRMLRSVHTTT
jgi:hypothetical protein